MQSDAESRREPQPRRDLWRLPRIESLEINRVRYDPPRRHVVGGEVVELDEGVEILVETSAEIPVRALSPAVFVGAAEIAENERTRDTTYRFFVLDEQAVRPGAPIRLGWVGQLPPEEETPFLYEPPSR